VAIYIIIKMKGFRQRVVSCPRILPKRTSPHDHFCPSIPFFAMQVVSFRNSSNLLCPAFSMTSCRGRKTTSPRKRKTPAPPHRINPSESQTRSSLLPLTKGHPHPPQPPSMTRETNRRTTLPPPEPLLRARLTPAPRFNTIYPNRALQDSQAMDQELRVGKASRRLLVS
jgi:hypothetical protein